MILSVFALRRLASTKLINPWICFDIFSTIKAMDRVTTRAVSICNPFNRLGVLWFFGHQRARCNKRIVMERSTHHCRIISFLSPRLQSRKFAEASVVVVVSYARSLRTIMKCEFTSVLLPLALSGHLPSIPLHKISYVDRFASSSLAAYRSEAVYDSVH
jgi:hypothetical protein